MIPRLHIAKKIPLKRVTEFIKKWKENIARFDASIRDSEIEYFKIVLHNDIEYINSGKYGLQTIVTILSIDLSIKYCRFKQFYWDCDTPSKTIVLNDKYMELDYQDVDEIEEFKKIANEIIKEELLW